MGLLPPPPPPRRRVSQKTALLIIALIAVASIATCIYFSNSGESSQQEAAIASIVSKLQVSNATYGQYVSVALHKATSGRVQGILASLNQLTPNQLDAGASLMTRGLTGLTAVQAQAVVDNLFGVASADEQAGIVTIGASENDTFAKVTTNAVYNFPQDLSDPPGLVQQCEEVLYGFQISNPVPACTSAMDQSLRVVLRFALVRAIVYEQGLGAVAISKVPAGQQPIIRRAAYQALLQIPPGELLVYFGLLAPPPPSNLTTLYTQTLTSCSTSPPSCNLAEQQFIVFGFFTSPPLAVPPQVQQAIVDCFLTPCSPDETQSIQTYMRTEEQNNAQSQLVISQLQSAGMESAYAWIQALGTASG